LNEPSLAQGHAASLRRATPNYHPTLTQKCRGPSISSGNCKKASQSNSHRALCTVEPISGPIKIDDVVLCRLNGGHNLRIVKASLGDRYLISNSIGGTKAWVTIKNIYGKLIHVE